MCDKAVHACLSALKFGPNWFVTNRRLEKIVFFSGDIGLDGIESDIVTFCKDDVDLFTIDFNNINLGNNSFHEVDAANIALCYIYCLA